MTCVKIVNIIIPSAVIYFYHTDINLITTSLSTQRVKINKKLVNGHYKAIHNMSVFHLPFNSLVFKATLKNRYLKLPGSYSNYYGYNNSPPRV